MVVDFAVFAIKAFFHIYNGFDVASLHIHHDGYAYVSVDFLQLVNDRTFCKVLHADINCGYDICTINRWSVGNVKELVANFSSVYNTIGTAKNGVVRQFQSESRRIFSAEHRTDSSASQRTVRTFTGIVFLPMESTLVGSKSEERQIFHFREGIVVDTLVVDHPMPLLLGFSLFQVSLKLCGTLFWEYFMKSIADGIFLDVPQGISFCLAEGNKVHEYLELRQGTGKELSCTAQDISSVRLNGHRVFLLSGGYLHPVVALSSHDI